MRRRVLSWWRCVRFRVLRARVERLYGARLYACALGDSRARALFEGGGVEDSSDGRLDCLTLHLHLYTERFKARFEAVVRVMMEAFVRDLDRSLREMGTSDLSVGKKVKKILSRVYGAFDAYRLARSREGRFHKEWLAALARNMPGADCHKLLAHARKVEKGLARSSLRDIVGQAQKRRQKRRVRSGSEGRRGGAARPPRGKGYQGGNEEGTRRSNNKGVIIQGVVIRGNNEEE